MSGRRQDWRGALGAAALFAAASAACGQGVAPSAVPALGADESLHLRLALRALNATVADAGFEKDVGKPLHALGRVRALLADPMGLPLEADRLACTGLPWRVMSDWVAAGCVRIPDGSPPGELNASGVPPALVPALVAFAGAAGRASALATAALRAVAAPDRQWLAASLWAGALRLEDDPAARAAAEAAGVAAETIAAVLADQAALDPAPGARRLLAAIGAIDYAALLAAGEGLHAAALALRDACAAVEDWPAVPVRVEHALGTIVIGTRGPDVYDGAALLILDPGGDDLYRGEAGVANGLRGQALAAIVDLAGRDRYEGEGLLSAGSGMFGVAVLVDAAGADRHAAAFAGQAAAVGGVAVLDDRGGDDAYTAGAFAQAAAYAGVAFLRDAAGADTYAVGIQGQAFAGLRAAAVLEDVSGNDVYTAGNREPDHERHRHRYLSLAQGFALGLRPFAGGGVAALVDRDGNDTYIADVFGQGASYWYSLGMLIDGGGHDRYSLYEYGQGAGIHLSHGLLVDAGGHDVYQGHSLAQGCAHDYAVGMLFDHGGNDVYTADHFSQGRAMNNSFALLADREGSDAYFARRNGDSQGVGDDGRWREYGSLSVLLDLAGEDAYTCGARDGEGFLRPDYGIVYDLKPTAEGKP